MYSEEDRAGSARMIAAKNTDMDNIAMAIEVVTGGLVLVANEYRLPN